MITGLANGAKEVIATDSIAAAGIIGRNSQQTALLCGEKNAKPIQGFNLGNSIKEYSEEVVKGKSLIFSSTNGTPALIKSKFTQTCIVAAFVNITRVTDYLLAMEKDFIILCAGKSGEFSLEDTVCAGMIINLLNKKAGRNHYQLTDSAHGASKLFSSYKRDLLHMLMESEHGRFLMSLGFEDDLNACAKVDAYNILPLQRNGVIRTIEAFESDPKLAMKKVTKSA
jgi:2-phosphosulfolactate phosphatase